MCQQAYSDVGENQKSVLELHHKEISTAILTQEVVCHCGGGHPGLLSLKAL